MLSFIVGLAIISAVVHGTAGSSIFATDTFDMVHGIDEKSYVTDGASDGTICDYDCIQQVHHSCINNDNTPANITK
jgi:hypothetical protein